MKRYRPRLFIDSVCPVDWAHPLNRGLLGLWMDPGQALPGWRGGATLRDLVRGGRTPHDGTLTNGPTWGGPRGRPGGRGSLSFDGTDDRLVIPAVKAWAVGDFYVSFWINLLAAASQFDTILSTYFDSATAQYLIVSFRNSSTTLNLLGNAASGSSGCNLDAPAASTVGAWEFWAFGRRGGIPIVSRNGAPAVVGAAMTGDASSDHVISVMDDGAAGRCPNALLDDLRIGDSAPTDEFLAALYDQSRRGHPDTLRWLSPRSWFITSTPPPVGQTFNAAWAVRSNVYLGPLVGGIL